MFYKLNKTAPYVKEILFCGDYEEKDQHLAKHQAINERS